MLPTTLHCRYASVGAIHRCARTLRPTLTVGGAQLVKVGFVETVPKNVFELSVLVRQPLRRLLEVNLSPSPTNTGTNKACPTGVKC